MSLVLALAATAASSEQSGAPAYASAGLVMGISGPFLAFGGGIGWSFNHDEKPWAPDYVPTEADLARRRRQGRNRLIGGSVAITGIISTIAGPPMLLIGGLEGSGNRSQAAGWTGVALSGVSLVCFTTAVALDNDTSSVFFATSGLSYVGALVAGGVQLAMDEKTAKGVMVPLAGGRF